MTGRLYGIGVGPGDPDLLTLKAVKVLRDVPVIAYPAPLEGESMARSIASPHIADGKREIPIRMPIDRNRFPVTAVYEAASVELGTHLDAGRDVAVLCEGDPFFYGSFLYLFGRLADAYPVTVVPGVSSLTASAAALGAPLAALDDALAVLPATLSDGDLAARLDLVDAAAIIKVGRHLGRVRRLLDGLGLADRSRFIEHATMQNQRISMLTDIADEKAPYFSIILIHKRGVAWR